MKIYHLTILSKNKKSLNDCCSLFVKLFYFVKIKEFNKQKKTKKLTILKSPHVNKTAQEQFETRFFSRKLSIYYINNALISIYIKKVINNLFPDIYIKIKLSLNKKTEKKFKLNTLNPNNFKINKNYYISQKIKKKRSVNKKIFISYKFVLIFDCYGELLLSYIK